MWVVYQFEILREKNSGPKAAWKDQVFR